MSVPVNPYTLSWKIMDLLNPECQDSPCSECMHCHHTAQDIEDLISESDEPEDGE